MANNFPDSFSYTEEDLENPQGQNNLGARVTFYQRSLYKERIYPTSFPSPLDIWYDKLMYGRVDQFQNSVTPVLQHLAPIPSAVLPNMMAINVVVGMFEKFVTHMARAVISSAVDKSGNPNMLAIKAERAYMSPNSKYATFAQSLYNGFKNSLTGPQNARIIDFASFVKVYKRYLLSIAAHTPVTKTNYLISQNGSIFTSGVSIAITNGDAGDDFYKYDSFIRDPNFEFYRRCAKKFGFLVNKNFPWVLTADLFTSAFEEAALDNYATSAGQALTRDNFFEVFYNKTYLTDIADLINIFINSYVEFLRVDPYYSAEQRALATRGVPGATLGLLGGGDPIVSKLREPLVVSSLATPPPRDSDEDARVVDDDTPRTSVTLDNRARYGAAQVLTDRFLIDFYIDLRQMEVGEPFSLSEVATLKKQAYQIYLQHPDSSGTPLQNVAEYVNRNYRNHVSTLGAQILQAMNTENGFSGMHSAVDNRTRE